jgi:undecaprenol kinase/diacylglycerol kinase (ATP)
MKQKTERSFINAFSGLKYFLRHESNGKIQSIIGFCTLLLAAFFHISYVEWVVILICIGSVLSLEMLNSALEKLCDIVQPDFHPQIKIIKDVAAGSVLWASIISASIGVIIFLPEILKYL